MANRPTALDDAIDVATAVFCVLAIATVCPFTVLLVFAGHGLAGAAGGWTVASLLAVSPILGGLIAYCRHKDGS
jgi:hypothetical protein